jgi:hypothetical protein
MFRCWMVCAALAGCSSPCQADLSGNFSASSSASSACGTLSQAEDGWTLGFQVPLGAKAGTLRASIDLGQSPSTGTLSSETVATWSASIANESDCLYSAASDGVPNGSFTLELSALEGTDGQGSPSAHGRLDVTQYLHAPPGVDCGRGDTENVAIRF